MLCVRRDRDLFLTVLPVQYKIKFLLLPLFAKQFLIILELKYRYV
jgi:hypothetical protein